MQGWVNKVVDRGSPHATTDNHVTIAGTRSESFRTTLKIVTICFLNLQFAMRAFWSDS
jgi:hypothetical protein